MVVYFVLVLLVRVIPRRNAGGLSPNDILTLVVGGIATDAMMGGSKSAGDLLLIGLAIGGATPSTCWNTSFRRWAGSSTTGRRR